MASRVNFNTIFAKYRKLGKGSVRLTQSTLFLSKPISATQTTYQFDVLETQTATLQADEIRLNLNDEFIITQMGMYLQASVGREGVAGGSIKKLFTCVPAELDNITAQGLQNFYAGQFQIAVNNIVYLDKYDTRKHEFVPRTQFQNFATPNGASLPSVNFSKDSMYPCEPLISLSGSKKNTLTLSLPSAITGGTFNFTDDKGAITTYTIDRVCVMLRGLNAQNGSVFQN